MALSDDWLNSYRSNRVSFAASPPRRSCATIAINYALMERHPAFRALLSELEHETSTRLARPMGLAADAPVTIPVVVHVLWHDAAENIDDAQIAGQIDVLNRDFAATNPDASGVPAVWAALVGDSGVRFALATRDPAGEPHGGVTRTETAITSFGSDDGMKAAVTGGADAWPAEHYLNIWVCNLAEILGYAQFPGGPPETDGVVIGHRYFGTSGTAVAPFDLGRTTTHEVGHWLNLRHIWGDTENCSGSDFVDDTPGQRLPNFGAPAFPSISCDNGPDGDMFMNYMDYVDDRAMFMFTTGQVARMQAALQSIRADLLTSDGIG